jgi:hypothetical protein
MSTIAETSAPARDGRVFVETPPAVAEAARRFLAADAAWHASFKQPLTYAETTPIYEAAREAEWELIRVMEEAQGRWARLAGYYEVEGPVWVGFDRIHSGGMNFTVKRTRPVFAKKGAR